MKTIIIVLLLVCWGGMAADQKWNGLPKTKLTVRVVNESRTPINGVLVSLKFAERLNPIGVVNVAGLTDSQGLFTGEGYTDEKFGTLLTADGYYLGSISLPEFQGPKDNLWQPWNPTIETVLRKIEKPSPVYAQRLEKLDLPVIEKPCGYDLQVGDWVAPWGKGVYPDFIMSGQRDFVSRQDFDIRMTLSFSNSLDGIQETQLPEQWKNSWFRWPRSAPDAGYISTLSTQLAKKPGAAYVSSATDTQAYFFRVRTVEKDGKIVSALYGKIRGGIQVEGRGSKTCSVAFTYYLNPTSLDRNMEFDLDRNLIKNLKPLDRPRQP